MAMKAARIMALALTAAVLVAATPVYAFDPQGKKPPQQQGQGQGMRQGQGQGMGAGRAPSSLYPKDERNRRAIDQLMRHDQARQQVESGTIRPLGEIRGQVRRQFSGRIVGVELYENQNAGRARWIYDVRVLTPRGDVLAVEMNAHTGQVVSVKGQR